MTSIFQHPVLGEVAFVRSRRARRVAIRVWVSGAVRLTCPVGVSQQNAIEFLEQRVSWVIATRERLARKPAAQVPQLSPQEQKLRTEELRRAAKADLPLRIERMARLTGLRYNKMTIRASRSKWGSCTGTNNISLSVHLMVLPEQLRDFVIIHELCHTVHHNHSPRFHALVDRLVGGKEKALNRELKAFSIWGNAPSQT